MGRRHLLITWLGLLATGHALQDSNNPATTCDEAYNDTSRACAYYTFGCGAMTASMATIPTCWSGTKQSPIHLDVFTAQVTADGELAFSGYSEVLGQVPVLRVQGYSLQLDMEATVSCTTTTTSTTTTSTTAAPAVVNQESKKKSKVSIDTGNNFIEVEVGRKLKRTKRSVALPHITGGPLGSDMYEFDHATWHWGQTNQEGSEHHLNGRQFPAEIQLYHRNTQFSSFEEAAGNPSGLAAVSFLYELSLTDNPNLSTLISNIVSLTDELNNNMGLEFEKCFPDLSLSDLLPTGGVGFFDNYFYYSGSLTQPGNTTSNATDCVEPVTWINYEKTIPISETQLNSLRAFLQAVNTETVYISSSARLLQTQACVHNYRPLHALNPTVTSLALVRQAAPANNLFYRNWITSFPANALPVFIGTGAFCLLMPTICGLGPAGLPPLGGEALPPADTSLEPNYQNKFIDSGGRDIDFCQAPGTVCDPLVEDLLFASNIEAANQAFIDLLSNQDPPLSWTPGRTSLFGESFAEVLAYRMGEQSPSEQDRSGSSRQVARAFLKSMEEAASGYANRKRRDLGALFGAFKRAFASSRPTEWDVYTSDVRNQGVCSACSAFAATAAFETCVQRTGNSPGLSGVPPTGLSQQNLLDCAFNSNGLRGCDGGQSFRYLQWMSGGGLEQARLWPYVDGYKKVEVAENASLRESYTQRDFTGRCSYPKQPSVISEGMVVSWDDHTERDIENILLDGHAVITTMEVTRGFQFYTGGVFYSEHCQNWLLGPNRDYQWRTADDTLNGFGSYDGFRRRKRDEYSTDNTYDDTNSQTIPTGLRPLRHAVVIVGFGFDAATGYNYWKVKNSWGHLWGESGFFKIIKGYGHCGIGAYIGVARCRECMGGSCDTKLPTANLEPPANLPLEEVFLGQTTFLASPVSATGELTCSSQQCPRQCPANKPCKSFCGPRCARRGGTLGTTQCCRPRGSSTGQRVYCPRKGSVCT